MERGVVVFLIPSNLHTVSETEKGRSGENRKTGETGETSAPIAVMENSSATSPLSPEDNTSFKDKRSSTVSQLENASLKSNKTPLRSHKKSSPDKRSSTILSSPIDKAPSAVDKDSNGGDDNSAVRLRRSVGLTEGKRMYFIYEKKTTGSGANQGSF